MSSNLQNRVKTLEKDSGAGDVYKYMCVVMEGWAAGWDTPEERAKGYKIQPLMAKAGGTGGGVFYLQTETDLNEFAARPDVNLVVIRVGYEEQA